MAAAGADRAHAVAHRGRRPASRRPDGPVPGREDQRPTLADRRHGGPRLRPRPLLDDDELTALVVPAGPVEADHDLQREHELAVEIAVQGVPTARPVAQQQRCRARLPAAVAVLEPVVQPVRPWCPPRQAVRPVPGDREQGRPPRRPQLLDDRWQRVTEVTVLALTEAVPGHVDGRSEPAVVGVEVDELTAGVGLEHVAGDGDADGVEVGVDRLPVEVVEPHGASRSSSRRLASTPPRYWPIEPSPRTTRWHGTTIGIGLDAQALPAARTARGEPTAPATTA